MRLAVLHPVDRPDGSIAMAREAGFETIAASLLSIVPNDAPEVDVLIAEMSLGRAMRVIVTSSTDFASPLTLAKRRGVDIASLLNGNTLEAIGPATAGAMRAEGIKVDMMPDEYTSTDLVELLSSQGVEGKRAFLLRSDHGERIPVAGLQDAGASVMGMAIHWLVPRADREELEVMAREALSGNIDAFAFSSTMTAATFLKAAERLGAGEEMIWMLNDRIVSAMGPLTRRRLEGMGIVVGAMPEHATFDGVLETIKGHSRR